MARVKLRERKIITYESRTVNVSKGELVLIVSKSQTNPYPLLAIFSHSGDGGGDICLDAPVIRLLPRDQEWTKRMEKIFYATRYSQAERYGYRTQSSKGSIEELVVGKEDILARVSRDKKIRYHMRWPRRLKRPYKLPQIKTVSYLEDV